MKHRSNIVDTMVSRLTTLERTRAKMELLFDQDRVARRDVEHIYGALFLTAFATFENTIEDLFLKMLCAKVTVSGTTRRRLDLTSSQIARDVVFNGRNYADWLPYDRTEKRAHIFFASGRPFTLLGTTEKTFIKSAGSIRNAIAHGGEHAKQEFDKLVIQNRTLMPRERTPTGFLRGLHSTSPNVTQYEQHIYDLTSIIRTIVK